MVSTCLTVLGTAFLKLLASLVLNFMNANDCGIPIRFAVSGSNAIDTMDVPFSDGNAPIARTLDNGTVVVVVAGFFMVRTCCSAAFWVAGVMPDPAALFSIFLIKKDRASSVKEKLKTLLSTHAFPILSISVAQNCLVVLDCFNHVTIMIIAPGIDAGA